jgi:hypothetical protein
VPALVATLGSSPYGHTFGGSRWSIAHAGVAAPGVQTLLTLDLTDPRLELVGDVTELPLCTNLYVVSLDRQSYRFDAAALSIALDQPPWELSPNGDSRRPLPLRMIQLRGATTREVEPRDDAIDTFIGGPAFLRVRGEPLWVGDPEEVPCDCGRASTFVAGVGYERYKMPSGIIDAETPFFLGELAFYFFACLPCRRVTVVTQPT